MRREALALITAAALAGTAGAFEISSHRQIDGVAPTLAGEGEGNTVTPSGASPDWTYSWADRDGDGSSNAVAAAGLSLGTRMIYCGRPNGTSRGEIVLGLDGGHLTGTGQTAIRSRRHDPEGATRDERLGSSDSIVIRNAGTIDAGGIDAQAWHEYVSTDYRAGDILIGSLASRAGPVRVGYLHAFAVGGRARAGNIEVNSTGDVLVADAAGNPGDIRAETEGWSGGDVLIDHYGSFLADRILTHTVGNRSSAVRAGDILLYGNDSSGDALIGEIGARNTKSNYSSSLRALLSVSGYRHVRIGGIDGSFAGGNVARYGSDLVIDTGIAGDIELTGMLDLRSVYAGNALPSYRGLARLVCAGTVSLAALDLDLVRHILLDSGAGFSDILGELANFDPAHDGGSGTESDPYIATQTALRAPVGQRIFYAVQDGLNAGLDTAVYRVACPDGNAGQGGLLAPEPVSGAMFRIH